MFITELIMKHTAYRRSSRKRHECLGRLLYTAQIAMVLILILPPESIGQSHSYDLNAEGRAPFQMHSGFYTRNATQTEPRGPSLAYSGNVTVPRALGFRIIFGDFNLGLHSYIVAFSNKDGAHQTLDDVSIRQWGNGTAFFNGETVTIELYVDARDSDVFFEITETQLSPLVPSYTSDHTMRVMSDDCPSSDLHKYVLESNCQDDRNLSTHPAAGRTLNDWSGVIVPNCTAWVTSSGALVSAGHCRYNSGVLRMVGVEFNSPVSTPDGVPQHPHPDHQYAVDQSSVIDSGPYSVSGNDWMVFKVHPNSNTGLLPAQAQESFYRISRNITLHENDLVTVIGHGVTEQLNELYKAQKDRTKPFISKSSVFPTFRVLTTVSGGDSGGPIIDESSGLVIGITTHGTGSDLDVLLCPATGQRFDHAPLASALNNILGEGTVFVDNGYPNSASTGTFLDPVSSVFEGISLSGSGGSVAITEGSYSEVGVIDSAVKLFATSGNVRIGGAGSYASYPPFNDPSIVSDVSTTSIHSVEIHSIFPNPVRDMVSVDISCSASGSVVFDIYDMPGRKVASVISYMEEGRQVYSFSASSLSAGVYVLKLSSSFGGSARVFHTIK